MQIDVGTAPRETIALGFNSAIWNSKNSRHWRKNSGSFMAGDFPVFDLEFFSNPHDAIGEKQSTIEIPAIPKRAFIFCQVLENLHIPYSRDLLALFIILTCCFSTIIFLSKIYPLF